VTSVGEKEEKANKIQPPPPLSFVFLTFTRCAKGKPNNHKVKLQKKQNSEWKQKTTKLIYAHTQNKGICDNQRQSLEFLPSTTKTKET